MFITGFKVDIKCVNQSTIIAHFKVFNNKVKEQYICIIES